MPLPDFALSTSAIPIFNTYYIILRLFDIISRARARILHCLLRLLRLGIHDLDFMINDYHCHNRLLYKSTHKGCNSYALSADDRDCVSRQCKIRAQARARAREIMSNNRYILCFEDRNVVRRQCTIRHRQGARARRIMHEIYNQKGTLKPCPDFIFRTLTENHLKQKMPAESNVLSIRIEHGQCY